MCSSTSGSTPNQCTCRFNRHETRIITEENSVIPTKVSLCSYNNMCICGCTLYSVCTMCRYNQTCFMFSRRACLQSSIYFCSTNCGHICSTVLCVPKTTNTKDGP